MDAAVQTDEIIFTKRGRIGCVLLNRPKALNALTADMCDALMAQLDAWRSDASVHAVVVRGAGEKAFCAGGDIVRLYEDGLARGPYQDRFFWTEYRLDTAIKFYPKPYIALIDGIVMGGGVGISIHGSHRVATDRTVFAMPETGIGLFPDVGGTYFLPRLPGRIGMYLGLTGRRIKAADCVASGLAQAYVPHAQLDALEVALAEKATSDASQITALIAEFAQTPEGGAIEADRAQIDRHFGGASVQDIIASLEADGGPWAAKVKEELLTKSPLSLMVTMRQLTEGAKLSFKDAMRLEWRVGKRITADRDFYEGVRALLIDKDMKPKWNPASLADVKAETVDAHFAPLPSRELELNDIIGAT